MHWINDTEYGLAAYVLRGSPPASPPPRGGHRCGDGRASTAAIVSDPSAPFGGIKQSGLGREGARDGLAAFQETQYFSIEDG